MAKPKTKSLSDLDRRRLEITNCRQRSPRTKRRALAAILRRQRKGRRS